MNYTLNQLQVFLKIVQTQSVTKAAAELNLTQPAVSIQLKNFQQQFDLPLTEVVGRKIYITDFGHSIAESAETILKEVHAIHYKNLAFKGQLSGKLRLSIVSTAQYIMPYFLVGFMNKHTGVELQMDVTNRAKVLESLENNSVDFALVSILPDNLSVNTLELLDNQLYLVGGRAILSTDALDLHRLFERFPLIFRELGSGTRQALERFMEQHQLPVRRRWELTSNEAVKQAVIAGLGCSIMPLISIREELQANKLQIIPVQGLPIRTAWRLIWMKGKQLSPLATALLEYIASEKGKIAKRFFGEEG